MMLVLGSMRDLFFRPMTISGIARLGMLVPLVLAISIVYKTIRCEKISSIPAASIVLCFTIVSVMMLIGVALYGVYHLLA